MTGERPDSIVEENVFGYVVRSSRERTFLVEVMFCATGERTGTWWVDEWAPVGETMVVRTGKEVE